MQLDLDTIFALVDGCRQRGVIAFRQGTFSFALDPTHAARPDKSAAAAPDLNMPPKSVTDEVDELLGITLPPITTGAE